jgi:hypothetical protein
MCSFLWPFSILFIHLSYDFILSNFLPFYAFLITVMLKPLLSFSFQPFFLYLSPLYKLALLIHLSPLSWLILEDRRKGFTLHFTFLTHIASRRHKKERKSKSENWIGSKYIHSAAEFCYFCDISSHGLTLQLVSHKISRKYFLAKMDVFKSSMMK